MTSAILKITNEKTLHQFIHHCIDDLVSNNRSHFKIEMDNIEWTKEDSGSALSFIQTLFRQMLKSQNWENSDLTEFNSKYGDIIKECYEIRKRQIYQAVLSEELELIDNRVVQNYDWKLKWVMGSSKLATLREPLLQLDLHCFIKESKDTRTINFEMSISQIDKLILDLEKAKEFISTR
ncbi:hypothetical protein FQA39_LY16205 [Lamprigera yunnana]|nr:hypothetical protein FQA39_LY16205 [Lamprigera yunnana]